ncbi:MAG: thioredoxin family protein [Firmicutes bacterium]|nr:thioredoxin family protein [Bacillota bacterium]
MEKNKALSQAALMATAGIPVVFVLEEVTRKDIIEKMDLKEELPVVAIDGKVVSSGKLLDKEELKKMFWDYYEASRKEAKA